VPELVVVMNRYERDQDATRLVLSRLVQSGLIRLAPAEDPADGMVADSSLLQAGGGSGAGGGLWTPGSPRGGGAAAEKPRIILPGQ
jgi:hypothetical protein